MGDITAYDIEHREVTLEDDYATRFIEADWDEKREILRDTVGRDSACPVTYNVTALPRGFVVDINYVYIRGCEDG